MGGKAAAIFALCLVFALLGGLAYDTYALKAGGVHCGEVIDERE